MLVENFGMVFGLALFAVVQGFGDMLGVDGRAEWRIEIDDGLSDLDDAHISTRGKAEATGSKIKSLFGGGSESEVLFNFGASQMGVKFGFLCVAHKLRVQSMLYLELSTSMLVSAKCCIF